MIIFLSEIVLHCCVEMKLIIRPKHYILPRMSAFPWLALHESIPGMDHLGSQQTADVNGCLMCLKGA